MVNTELALNPDTESHAATPVAPAGAYGTPELTVADPRVTVAFAVMVNAAVAMSPRLSLTVIIWLPDTKSAVKVAADTWNWNADVPCSVTDTVEGIIVVIEVGVGPLPIHTLLKVAPGPNPVTVAVTSVPTGPEAGDSVTVGTLRTQFAMAELPKTSVKLNTAPEVIAGRLTVPVYPPEEITFELKVYGEEVNAPVETVIEVPAKVAVEMVLVTV